MDFTSRFLELDSDVSRALAEQSEEIIRLKDENEKLREELDDKHDNCNLEIASLERRLHDADHRLAEMTKHRDECWEAANKFATALWSDCKTRPEPWIPQRRLEWEEK